MKVQTHKCRHGLLLVIFFFSMFGNSQECKSQWWKDTVWTKNTDQMNGFYMLKFSLNDSIIVGHGMQMDLFFDAKNGNEIKRIPGNNEVFFINNDKNFVRLREDNSKFEIFDTKTFSVIASIENDEKHINEYPIIDISQDEKYLIAGIPKGFRIWDIQNKKIFKTMIYPDEPNLVSVGINNPRFICGTNKVMVQLSKKYKDHNYGDFVIYDINTLDSVDSYGNHRGFVLSHNCQYIAYGTGDMYNGVEVYDFNTKQLLWKIPVNGPSLTGLEFSPDDKYLVTASNNSDYGMKIWSLGTGKMVYDYISGATYRNIDLSNNGKYLIFSIGNDLYLYKTYFDEVSVNEPFDSNNVIYPNPTTDYIIVGANGHLPLKEDGVQQEIRIFDIFGKCALNIGAIHELPLRIDISTLPEGVYFLRAGSEVYKFMIVR